MSRSALYIRVMLVLVLLFPAQVVWPQVVQENKLLVVNGHSGETAIIQINGRPYVDLEALVRVANGSLTFQGNEILLTLPTSSGSTQTSQPQDNTSALSRQFMKAGIEEIGLLREWAIPIADAMKNGYPITESWVATYQGNAETGLRTALASASTDADRSASQLLTNEFEAVRQWSANLVEARKTMSTANYATSPDAFKNDPLSQKIIDCARFLGPMLASGSFQDNASCH
jgi:hypothetical protein